MATTLLALIDDIASLLDDVSAMTKVAAHKTAGVLGDDLALNAQQVAGVTPDRELPVVWRVAKGSMINKAILVPAALAISAIAPWAVTPLLMLGGAYLCYEGFEKVAHRLFHSRKAGEHHAPVTVESEKDKIKGAIRTDFILSAEIIVITLGTVAKEPFITQVGVLAAVAVLMTIVVYGLVGGIVKLDDFGLFLTRRPSAGAQGIGRAILAAAPWLMKALSIFGTAAMFLVGGGILVHGTPPLAHAAEAHGHAVSFLLGGVVGVVAGGLVLAATLPFKRKAASPETQA
ncbi:DUF808 domain-containing protein [Ramlibacter albus]|uniref:DUF808 domain-containing protein n=1 Tax=Ramlibacter albus TaxID=2079448 RepID=A0A923MAS2_9BURK|nr:DUF808 domain-containing protein [Ramlibacter albus]MBC5767397.1 DUF808 domain-containing protein [Ramlibacter albus]